MEDETATKALTARRGEYDELTTTTQLLQMLQSQAIMPEKKRWTEE